MTVRHLARTPRNPRAGCSPDWPAHEFAADAAARLAALRTAQMPYLFIAGDKVGPDYLNWLNHVLPQASVTEWPASGHFPHLAHPRRFAECLAAGARTRAQTGPRQT
jgi:pimeloyl-ACP methyl ester carboxylesterase